LLALSAVGLMALLCVLLFALRRPGPAGAYPVRSHNAAWLGVEWVNEPHTTQEIDALADQLCGMRITTLYVYVSYMRPDGSFGASYAHASEFVDTLKRACPEVCVQAWIGLPLAQRGPSAWEGHVELWDLASREAIVAFCVHILQVADFDGIHLDPEPVSSDDGSLLALLEETRSAVAEDYVLSLASKRILWFGEGLLARTVRLVAWSPAYYRNVAARVDEVALMTYDTMLPLPDLYRAWTHFQVVALTRALEATGTRVFIGVPTSEERTWTHRPYAENMTSGLLGLLDGLADSAARPDVVTGAAVYPLWETDEEEWATYVRLWLGEP